MDPAAVERVHGFHASRCPVARSLEGAIEVTTSYELVLQRPSSCGDKNVTRARVSTDDVPVLDPSCRMPDPRRCRGW